MSAARILALILLAAAIGAPAAGAEFYKGRTIRILLSAGVAGGYAEYARLLSRHWGDHIAGSPGFIVESMPGAGGLVAANYLYFQAPKDGLTVGLIHSTLPLAPLFGTKGARFDAQKFQWIGSMDQQDGMCTAWHETPIARWQDVLDKPFIVGSSGAGSMDIIPTLLNKYMGTHIKVISGYKDGTDIFLAMQRGEVEGRCSPQLTVLKSTRPEWLARGWVKVPILIGDRRSPDFPDTPTILELVKDQSARQQFELLILEQHMDRPALLPPGVDAARVAELRGAFDATMQDASFRAEADKMRLHLDPIDGPALQSLLDKAYALPPDVIEAAKAVMGNPSAE
jgi:tripartite-type tricarboxylate transporter receptor subunit TctC